jgi:uncharacterized protein YbjQ (UPF0145 family)
VRGNARFFWHTEDDIFNAMRERARRMGGHAIVGLQTRDALTGNFTNGRNARISRQTTYTGTVVRFRPDCPPEVSPPG